VRQTSPLVALGPSLISAEPLLTSPEHAGKVVYSPARVGARLQVAAQPGMTREWLQRILECHRQEHLRPGPPPDLCPLGGVDAVNVSSLDGAFAIELRARAANVAALLSLKKL
jgi:hypothetical protein